MGAGFAAGQAEHRQRLGEVPFVDCDRSVSSKKGDVMNWDWIEGNWKQFTGKVKE